MRRAAVPWWLTVALLLGGGPRVAGAADPDLSHEEKLLRDAGVKVDGPGLLAFLRSRTLTPSDQERLGRAGRLLGDAGFRARERAGRELLAAGPLALPYPRPAPPGPPPGG